MKRSIMTLLVTLALLMAGCSRETVPAATRAMDVEPTATYDWMAGESPVPNKRIGLRRDSIEHSMAVSPNGIYYLYSISQRLNETPISPMILYLDNGSDTMIKLCGRSDCTHDNTDCNAYVECGERLTYYNGYLYVISQKSSFAAGDGEYTGYGTKLLRMDPDGTNRVVVFDLQKFADEKKCDFTRCNWIIDGYCMFSTCNWKSIGDNSMTTVTVDKYLYKLDSSMDKPKVMGDSSGFLHNCGNVFLTYRATAENGGEFGSYWDWDPETDSLTYLADHPGEPGWFGETEAYYFMNGAVHRLTYATGEDEVVIQTDLDGDYYACCFPDCIMIVSKELQNVSDKNLYFFNWDFQYVDTVQIVYSGTFLVSDAIMGETVDKVLLTKSSICPVPTHYIDKAELGTGNARVHEFDLTAIEEMVEAVKKMYPNAGW